MLHTFVEIESIVNNRLSTPLTNDPNDTKSLKPNHFLVARASPNERFIATTEKDRNLSAKSKATQAMKDIFWKKWIKEYLLGLTKRQIWMSYLQDIKVGNLVIIAEGNIEILKQPLFRVVETFPGKDQVVGSEKTIYELAYWKKDLKLL